MSTEKRNETVISKLFPGEVITEEVNPERIAGTLYPEEEALIRNAVPKRRREFIAGRLCARKALLKLGIRDFPLVNGEDRSPVWPPGIVGSISHADGYCGVALARKAEFKGVGLDVECVGRIERKTWKHICTEKELAWLNSLPLDVQEQNVALIFSAKECLYKCQYAISKQWLNFHDVAVSIVHDPDEFEASFIVDRSDYFAKGACLKGKFLFQDDYVFAGMAIKTSPHTETL